MNKMKLDIQLFAVTKTTTFNEPALTETNIIENQSSLSITIYFSPNNTSTWFSSKKLSCTCNGVTQSANVGLSKGGSVTKTFTFNNIAHENDGTKTVSWSWNCNTGTSVLGNIGASGTKQLQTIPRASDITSVTNGTTEYAPVVKWTPKNNTFKFKVKYSYGSWNYFSGIISPATTSETQYNGYTIPHTVFNNAPNNAKINVTATLYTYQSDGTTLVGEKTKTFEVTLNTSKVPSVSIGTLTEANTQMRNLNWGVFVQNKSQLNIPITASGTYNSTISSVVTTINNISFSGTNITTSTLVTAGNNTISTKATDSRGRQATTTKTYNVVTYTNPSITTAIAVRCLQNGTESDEGTYLKYSFVGSISPVSNKNAKTFRIGYKPKSSGSYTYVNIENSAYSINKSNQILSGVTLDTSLSYDIVFEAIDTFTTTKIDRQLESGFDLMNFNASGKAMAIGKVSEASANEELLEIGLSTKHFENVVIHKATGESYVEAKRTDTGVAVDLMVGSGGINHGVYSDKLKKWMLYADNTNIYVNGTADNANKLNNMTTDRIANTNYIASVTSAGVLEAGRYIDFHHTVGSTNDFDTRLQSNGTTKNTVNLPTKSGTLALETNYSSTETITGYLDGKPIYSKVISGSTSTSANSVSINHNISNLKEVISYKGWFTEGSNRRFIPQFYYTGETKYNFVLYTVNDTQAQFYYGDWAKSNQRDFKVILEYTKTTD